ncbi:MAG: hypothetical protein ACLS95_06670 [Clostridia bacterium]
MKQESGITLVALVVTVIILIILAGISINTLMGDNGIITKAKQAKQNITLAGEAEAMQLNQLYYELETGGELTEDEESSKKDEIISLLQKQVEELQKQIASLQTENTELKQQIETLTAQIASLQKELQDLKAQIAEKNIEITELKKQVSEKEAKIQELQNQLNSLNSLLSQTNATADKILSGYKAYSGGKLLTGTMVNRGAVNSSLNCGQSYTIPAGYHNGSGKITANSLASQTQATADASKILKGYTAWVNGNKITGNNQGYEAGYNDGYNTGQTNVSGLKLANSYINWPSPTTNSSATIKTTPGKEYLIVVGKNNYGENSSVTGLTSYTSLKDGNMCNVHYGKASGSSITITGKNFSYFVFSINE